MQFNRFHVGERIHLLIRQKGYRQKDVARRIGVDVSVLRYYFGRTTLSIPVLRRLSVILGEDLVLPYISRASFGIYLRGQENPGQAEIDALHAAFQEEKQALGARIAELSSALSEADAQQARLSESGALELKEAEKALRKQEETTRDVETERDKLRAELEASRIRETEFRFEAEKQSALAEELRAIVNSLLERKEEIS